MSGMRQSISGLPTAASASLIAEKGRLPKNPLRADSGEGCAEAMIVCFVVSISSLFFPA